MERKSHRRPAASAAARGSPPRGRLTCRVVVDVCYQDKGYLPRNSLIFTTCGFSTDHALSFTNQQVTTVPFDASNNNFIGDYN
jgi:hypothetical protein